MNTSKPLENYFEKMSLIILYQRRMRDALQREVEYLVELKEKEKKAPPDEKENFIMHDYMGFLSIKGLKYFGENISRIDERISFTIEQKNKLYQWLLVDAFENFETFLKETYALAGYIDNSIWVCEDFGKISLEEIQNKSFAWFLKQSKNKHHRDPAISILNRLRVVFPELEKIEAENSLNINFKLALILIMQFRHVIVHRSGEIIDKEEFTQNVFRKAGLSQNETHNRFVKHFYENMLATNQIELFELKVGIGRYDRFAHLLKILLAYADFISEKIVSLNTNEATLSPSP